MSRRFCLLASVVAVFAVATPAHASRTGPASRLARASNTNPATFNDSLNDSGTAPDIQSVVVSNDENGNYRFRINVNKLTLPSSTFVLLALDSDQNIATGQSGFDYIIACDESSGGVALLRWDGSQYVAVAAASLSANDNGAGVTLQINKNDLGGVTTLQFAAESDDTSGGSLSSPGHFDSAPDTGVWAYQQTSASAVGLAVAAFAAPKTVRAGKTLLVRMIAARTDTGDPVNDEVGASVSCTASIGGKRLRLVGVGFIEGTSPEQGACVWRVPKNARGKTIRGSITITFNGVTATHTFVSKVK
jgi:hypothetical protein